MSTTLAPDHAHVCHDERVNEAVPGTKLELCTKGSRAAIAVSPQVYPSKDDESVGYELALAREDQGSDLSNTSKNRPDDPLPVKRLQLVLLGLAMALAVFLMALDEGIIGKLSFPYFQSCVQSISTGIGLWNVLILISQQPLSLESQMTFIRSMMWVGMALHTS